MHCIHRTGCGISGYIPSTHSAYLLHIALVWIDLHLCACTHPALSPPHIQDQQANAAASEVGSAVDEHRTSVQETDYRRGQRYRKLARLLSSPLVRERVVGVWEEDSIQLELASSWWGVLGGDQGGARGSGAWGATVLLSSHLDNADGGDVCLQHHAIVGRSVLTSALTHHSLTHSLTQALTGLSRYRTYTLVIAAVVIFAHLATFVTVHQMIHTQVRGY